MPGVELETGAVRRALEAILNSPGFVRNDRLSAFLRFLVERHLEGRDRELKESVIGTEVFGRKPDYSPKSDPIVRTEARRLRDRLSQYYEDAGANESIRIELPKGGYVPVIQSAVTRQPSRTGRWAGIAAAGLLIVFAVAGVVRSRRPTNTPAYDLYTRARAFEMQPNVTGVESSIDLFQQAILKDGSFAPAHAGIAAGYAARSGFDGYDDTQRAEMFEKGWAAARKALELDRRSADAYDGLAMMQARTSQWPAAERSFRRAFELAPSDLLWRDHFVMFLLLPLGRLDEAIRQLRIAEELDPLDPQTHTLLASALNAVGRHDEALFHCQKAAQNDRARGGCWANNLLREGRADEALRILESFWNGRLMEPGAQSLAIAYVRAGRSEEAERIAAILPRLASKAQVYAAMGDRERTLALLDRIAPMGPARMGRDFLISPNFAFLRGDPRLADVRRKAGLPD